LRFFSTAATLPWACGRPPVPVPSRRILAWRAVKRMVEPVTRGWVRIKASQGDRTGRVGHYVAVGRLALGTPGRCRRGSYVDLLDEGVHESPAHRQRSLLDRRMDLEEGAGQLPRVGASSASSRSSWWACSSASLAVSAPSSLGTARARRWPGCGPRRWRARTGSVCSSWPEAPGARRVRPGRRGAGRRPDTSLRLVS
jgi:hypothetical protein